MAAGKPVVYVDLGIFRIFPSARPLLNRLVPRIELGRGWEDQLQRAVMKLLREPKQVASGNAFLGAYASLKFSPENLWTALREAAELAPARAETPRAALRH